MHRIVLTVLLVLLVGVMPGLAQQSHVLMTPDALKWVDPPTFPGAKLAIVQGDPGKEGLFVYRVKLPANYKIAPHFHKSGETSRCSPACSSSVWARSSTRRPPRR